MALTPTRRGVRLPEAGFGGGTARWIHWALLLALLVGNLGLAAFVDRPEGELAIEGSTYALQAASVAFDRDLQYGRADFDRFVAQRGRAPTGVVLRSPDRGERIVYGVPIPYAVVSAPVVRFAPVAGPLVVNALLLALAAVVAATTLERRLGPPAPSLVAAFVFASTAFAATYRTSPETLAASAVALAFALALRGEGWPARRFTEVFAGALPGEEIGWALGRWIAVGALIATASCVHPFYLLLLLPLALAGPRLRRLPGLTALLGATLLTLAAWGALQSWSGGSWVPWDRGGRVFTPETGFPAVDVPVAAWPQEEPAAWRERWLPGGPPDFPLDSPPPASLWGWNLLFLLAGRHVGLLPYFLPAVLGFLAFQGDRGRALAPVAVAVALLGLLWVRPFDLGPAFFLPLYPALWFLAARPLRPAWIAAAALVAGPFVYPWWIAAAAPGGGPAAPSPVAERLLPLETTQAALPGVTDLQQGALWVRTSSDGLGPGPRDLLRLARGRRGDLWLGAPIELPSLRLVLAPGGPTQAEVRGAELLRTVLKPDGGVVLDLDPGEPDRRHPVPWSSNPYSFYHLGLRFPDTGGPGPVDFELLPVYDSP